MVKSSVLRLLLAWAAFAAAVLPVFSQTKLDLQHQARGIDFSGATYTKPVRMGSALPSTCMIGEGYFLNSAPAGSNFYLCLSPNVWVLQGASSGSGSATSNAAGTVLLPSGATSNILGTGASGVQSYIGNSIVAFGATGNGTTNDLAAINAAIQATPNGGTVYVPPGQYLLEGTTGTELILFSKNVNMQCAGWGLTQFIIASNVPNTIDWVHYTASSQGQFMRDCQFLPQSATPGRYGIYIDGTSANIEQFDLSHNQVQNPGSGYALAMVSNVYDSIVQNNRFTGGIYAAAGDRNILVYNETGGPGPGIYFSQVPGSYGNLIHGNSITNCSGAIVVVYAQMLEISANEIEPASGCADDANHAAIDLQGVLNTPLQGVKVIHNQINPLVTTMVNLIRVDQSWGAIISENECSTYASDICVVQTTNAKNTRIGLNYLFVYGPDTALLSDSGSGTIRYDKTGVQNLQGGLNVGSITTAKLVNPGAYPPTVAANCASSCNSTWTYTYTDVDAAGNETLAASSSASVSNNATLNGSNYNTITPIGLAYANHYNIYRTASGGTPAATGCIGSVWPQNNAGAGGGPLSLVDTGLTAGSCGSGTSTPTINATGAWNGMIIPIAGGGMYFNGPSELLATNAQESGSLATAPVWSILDATQAVTAAITVNAASQENTWFGVAAGYTTTSSAQDDVGIGDLVAFSNTTGSYDTWLGYVAGFNNTTGQYNTCIGEAACYSNRTGGSLTAVGQAALYHATAANNTAIGSGAGNAITTGASDTALGFSALYNNTTGSNVVAIGATAGNTIGDGSTAVTAINNSVLIGTGAEALTAAADTNEICIAGSACKGQGSNTTHIGNSGTVQTMLEGIVSIPTSGAVASASTIAPTRQVFHVTGTTAILTITPPAACTVSGYACQLTLIPDGPWTTAPGGNIALGSTAVVNRALLMTYEPGTAKWYPSY